MIGGQLTGKDHDAEAGLDYFGARYFSGAQGRFTSPDPHNIITEASSEEEFASFLSNPQNWNRYAYVTNNPLRYVDPDGRCPTCLIWLSRLSPYADKAAAATQRYGQQAYLWAASFVNSPTGQQAVQTGAELATGTVMPGKIGQALAQMKDTGKQVIIYGEGLTKGFVKEAQREGIKVAENLEELKKLVGGQ